MFAIAFDLVVAEVGRTYPRHLSQAYADIESTLRGFGFGRIQGSVSVCEREDFAQWSDFTAFMKESAR